MIGKFDILSCDLKTTSNGNIEFTALVSPQSRYAAKATLKAVQADNKEMSLCIDYAKKTRTIDQNSLLWALLTIYADAQGGGRKGSVTPEDIYYRMLSKYGIAEYMIVPEESVENLKRAYRDTEIIDNAIVERNGKKTPGKLVKCILGSSQYDTKEMSQIIDGVFDELAQIGVDASTSKDVADYYDDWQKAKK